MIRRDSLLFFLFVCLMGKLQPSGEALMLLLRRPFHLTHQHRFVFFLKVQLNRINFELLKIYMITKLMKMVLISLMWRVFFCVLPLVVMRQSERLEVGRFNSNYITARRLSLLQDHLSCTVNSSLIMWCLSGSLKTDSGSVSKVLAGR